MPNCDVTTLLGIEFWQALIKVYMAYPTFSSMLLLLALFSSSLCNRQRILFRGFLV